MSERHAILYNKSKDPRRREHKPNGYWNDFANVERELVDFIAQHGSAGVMPNAIELRAAGRSTLSRAIGQHGGYPAVAQRLGLERRGKVQPTGDIYKPSGYWNDFSTLERELRAFAAEHGTEGIMPTAHALQLAGRHDLTNAIYKHGGYRTVRIRLGLARSDTTTVPPDWEARLREAQARGVNRKPLGYWKDFTNLERELRAFIRQHGTDGTMPDRNELKAAGRGDLAHGITVHGGFAVVATRLELKRAVRQRSHDWQAALRRPTAADRKIRPLGYWEELANIERELSVFLAEYGSADVMPTFRQFLAASRADLAVALRHHGGLVAVAERLRLKHPDVLGRAGDWQAAARAAQARGSSRKPPGYWLEFANVERELRAFITQYGPDSIMPTHQELVFAGRCDLRHGIGKHGGIEAVRIRLGLLRWDTRTLPDSRSAAGSGSAWDHFTTVEEALHIYIARYGVEGVMPTRRQLRARGYNDLCNAIRRHGGFRAVAARLGLHRPWGRKRARGK